MKTLLKKFGLPTLIIATVVVITLIISKAFLGQNRQLTDVEQIAIENFSNSAAFYFDVLDPTDPQYEVNETTKLIAFSSLYSAIENNKTELTLEETKTTIESFFNTDISIETLAENSSSPFLNNNYIFFDPSNNSFIYQPSSMPKQIVAETPITHYLLASTSIKNNVITATYKKYLAAHPYDVFNDATANNLNTDGVGDYLDGTGDKKSIKRLITSENADRIAEYQSDFTVTYVVHDDKIKIESFK